MANLGTFKESTDSALIRVKGSIQLAPATVAVQVRFDGGETVDLPLVADADTDGIPTNEFKNDPPLALAGHNPGFATVKTSAKDTLDRLGQRIDTIKITSEYGRNYGRDYGNGM